MEGDEDDSDMSREYIEIDDDDEINERREQFRADNN